jgi:hypothetical protein
MGVIGRLRVFVVKEPVVAASYLIAGFGTLSSPISPFRTVTSALCPCVVYAYVLRPDLSDVGCACS